jgi:ABC-type polysaccharide/polyol phosphate transport system ATPase subunit
MSAQPVISFDSVSLTYKTESSRRTLKSATVDAIMRKNRIGGVKYQIDDFTVSIAHGEQIGIIGRNGSGKSTFLKLVAGVLIPDKGSITIDGTITPLIDIGAGMHPDLTCEDNIYLSGAYLGLSRKQMRKHFDGIVTWAEIENVLDSQFHSLSTGTQSRLAFSVATSLTPDIVLVDEVLSVGDIGFQRKSKARMEELKSSGSAVLIVSHDLEYLAGAVERVIWIRDGKLYLDGCAEEVLASYKASF